MTDYLNKEYKNIISELDKNISNPEELEYVKNQVYKLSTMFINEMEEVTKKYEDKINNLEQKQLKLEEKIKSIQKVINTIEKDIYDNELDTEEYSYDFQILCPYCNYEFVIEMDEMKEEVTCPECKNVIELDWDGNEEECNGNCSHCHEWEEHTNENIDINNIDEDDM